MNTKDFSERLTDHSSAQQSNSETTRERSPIRYNLGANAARIASAVDELKRQAAQARELTTKAKQIAKQTEAKLIIDAEQQIAELTIQQERTLAEHAANQLTLSAWHQSWQRRLEHLKSVIRKATIVKRPISHTLENFDQQQFQNQVQRLTSLTKCIETIRDQIQLIDEVLKRIGYQRNTSAIAYKFSGQPEELLHQLLQQLQSLRQRLAPEQWLTTRSFYHPFVIMMTGLLAVAMGVTAGLLTSTFVSDPYVKTIIAGSLVTAGIFILVQLLLASQRRIKRITATAHDVGAIANTVQAITEANKKMLDPLVVLEGQTKAILSAELAKEQAAEAGEQHIKSYRQSLAHRLAALTERHDMHFSSEAEQITHFQQTVGQQFVGRRQALKQAQQQYADRILLQQQATVAEHQQAIEHAIANTIAALAHDLERANESLRSQYRTWSHPLWSHWEMPRNFPVAVPCARLWCEVADLIDEAGVPKPFARPHSPQRIEISADLALPEAGLLLVEGDHGLAIIHQAMVRLLVGSPAGKIRFSLIDPLGLGNHFAPFLRLHDSDKHVVGAKVWTSQVEIERLLANLSEHAEKVIQKYLRDRYATLAEYNEVAGILAEPYQVLVIADFPHGFSDLSLERLVSLVQHGPRCGIFVWIHGSKSIPFPSLLSRSEFINHGVVLQRGDSSWQTALPILRSWECEPEGMPDTSLFDSLLDQVAKRTAECGIPALHLTSILKKSGPRWQRTTANELRIPIGQTGADRIQELVLGHGTAQHVLIGGRTGSGKSTLLHAIISAGAWHFAPDQLSFYLIDFKKGVEFKIYGTTHLPHAKVVAVESDREFGLSVLRELDKELDDRGRRFRAAGVQDLVTYRQKFPSEDAPRVMLVIDEFQELFIEDDAIAHDAAMLLDRFVRQGRAFGMHVILGSQSLGGSSALARSTIGQIGVRIALQCSEVDSQLILSDENTAARLLDRPGEAIYNDRSGQREGNSPFQVFWLNGHDHRALLVDLPHDGLGKPQVFEGSAPALMTNNQELSSLLVSSDTQQHLECWLGEPNTLGGPRKLQFGTGAGGNLLVVGHNHEAGMGMVIAAICALCAGHPPSQLRIRIIDGVAVNDRATLLINQLISELPHDIQLIAPAAAAHTISELAVACADGARVDVPTVLFVLGLQRLRDLRMSDAFAFQNERGPGDRFAELLANGPDGGVHTWVWCDTVGNLSRALNRTAQRALGQRVAFQMSTGDSSDLIDDGSASQLGIHNALLVDFAGSERCKFRPYTPPESSALSEYIAAIRVKWNPISKDQQAPPSL